MTYDVENQEEILTEVNWLCYYSGNVCGGVEFYYNAFQKENLQLTGGPSSPLGPLEEREMEKKLVYIMENKSGYDT